MANQNLFSCRYRKTILILLVAVATTFAVSYSPAVLAQQASTQRTGEELKSFVQSVARVTAFSQLESQKHSLGYYVDGPCLLGAVVRNGQSATIDVKLKGRRQYLFIAGGDNIVREIGIQIVDSSGRIQRDVTSYKNFARTFFVPPNSGSYKITLKPKRTADPSFCTLAVLQSGGWRIPLNSVKTVTLNYAKSAVIATAAVEKVTDGRSYLSMNQQGNDWIFFGSFLKSGDASALVEYKSSGKYRAMLSAGDHNAVDINLHLLDEEGRVVAEDVKKNNYPMVLAKTLPTKKYRLQVSLPEGRLPTMVMTGMFDFEPIPQALVSTPKQ